MATTSCRRRPLRLPPAREDLGISQRRFARQRDIPKSTFQRWVGRSEDIDAPEQTVAFFESPEGIALLHRIVVAAMLVITQVAPGGIRLVGTFPRLSGLDRFAACSKGVLHKAVTALETASGVFGQEVSARLGKLKRPRQITRCQDETFHPEVCLVAIEPIRQFVLVEPYAQRCDRQR